MHARRNSRLLAFPRARVRRIQRHGKAFDLQRRVGSKLRLTGEADAGPSQSKGHRQNVADRHPVVLRGRWQVQPDNLRRLQEVEAIGEHNLPAALGSDFHRFRSLADRHESRSTA